MRRPIILALGLLACVAAGTSILLASAPSSAAPSLGSQTRPLTGPALAAPRLLTLSYGRFRPEGAPHSYWALRLLARQPAGQIVSVHFAVEPGGQQAVTDGGCGLGGRTNGGPEATFLPITLAPGSYRVTVTAEGAGCPGTVGSDPGPSGTRATRTFRVHVATPAARVVIGHSVRGRPIVAWSYGPTSAPRKILVIGVIHGNETAGLAITTALAHRPVPAGVQLWVLPELNPDGVAADTRQNAHGVDLNRNFPYRWQYTSDPTYASGPRPVSEPETRAAMQLVRRIHPAVTITYHQHMDLVDAAGGDRGVARRYAQLSGLRDTCLTFLPGEETRWSNHTFPGTTSFVVELPAGPVGPAALSRHLRALRAVELGQRSGSPTRCDSTTVAQ